MLTQSRSIFCKFAKRAEEAISVLAYNNDPETLAKARDLLLNARLDALNGLDNIEEVDDLMESEEKEDNIPLDDDETDMDDPDWEGRCRDETLRKFFPDACPKE